MIIINNENFLFQECNDRHVSCKQWKIENQCFGNSDDFMAENCRSSCQLCGKPKNMNCQKRKIVNF